MKIISPIPYCRVATRSYLSTAVRTDRVFVSLLFVSSLAFLHGQTTSGFSNAAALSSADMLVMLASPAASSQIQGQSSAAAAGPETDVTGLLDEAAQAATKLQAVKAREEKEFKPKVISWRRRLDVHNANPCSYPPDHPEVCAGYNQEAASLNAEAQKLRAELQGYEDQIRDLRQSLGMLKARIRIAAILRFNCHCDGLPPEEAKACWDRCFDGADSRLKSCLNIADLDQFAACLSAHRRN